MGASTSTCMVLGVLAQLPISLIAKIRLLCFWYKLLLESRCNLSKYSILDSISDYCNAWYYNLPAKVIYKLEKVQNSAARVRFQCKKCDHITPYLQKLHWFPVSYRIIHKVACICFKAYIPPLFPQYLSELMIRFETKRNLRSSTDSRLPVLSNRHAKGYGQRCFSNAAPKLWNSLPFSIHHSKNLKSFQAALKTHFFKKAYCL